MCDSNGTHEACTCGTGTSGQAHSHHRVSLDGPVHEHDHSSHDHASHEHAHSLHEHGGAGHHHASEETSLTAEFGVEGMTCSHCIASVTEELSQLDGVTNVDIDLVAGGVSRVKVGSSRSLSEQEIASAVDEAGYELADLPR